MSVSQDGRDSTANTIDIVTDMMSDLSHIPAPRASRAYQLEMLRKSLEENVIVAMDTGSGKTQIAILRIRAQLESSVGEKIIWFLAPTVLLCAQQFDAIKFEIPSVSIRLVIGSDNVHTWGLSTWKALLTGTQVVVSTYQVLLDALDHAFVKLNRMSLLIFDEAHNCVGSNPGGRIMTNFYHYERQCQDENNSASLPAILGLTATPSMRAHVTGLEQLENLLNAKCISPSIHRRELLEHVKRPQLRVVQCEPCTVEKYTESILSLQEEYAKMNILEDPYVIFLRTQSTERSIRELEKVVTKQRTWSRVQVSSLLGRAIDIQQQLGAWAANLYIWKCKKSFLQSLRPKYLDFESWIPEEKSYVADVLRNVTALEPAPRPMGLDSISDRVQLLLRELLTCQGGVVGIIFVRERVTAAMLAALLESLPKIRERYRVGCMVGTSQNQFRKRALYEFFDPHDLRTLHDFRDGKINLLVATSVLEEGIDVPACNLVMCFDSPPTPKSFIQRRGRARMQDSTLLLFTDRDSSQIEQWATFEEVINNLCQDTERERRELEALEDVEEDMDLSFRVAHTGARLDHDNAKQHLEHFCRVISPGQYADGRPDYIVTRAAGTSDPLVSAEVILPASLPPKLRRIQSSRSWKSDRNAIKDAAFQAYLSLYHAGLINKHLLPLETEEDFGVETRAAIVGVEAPCDPWPEVVSCWEKEEFRSVYTVQVQSADDTLFGEYSMTLPVELGTLVPIQLYLDYNTTYELIFSSPRRISVTESDQMADHTSALIGLHFCHRWPMEEAPHVVKFTSHDDSFTMGDIGNRRFDPTTSAAESENYLVRDHSKAPCRYIGEIPSKPSISEVQRPFRDYEDAPDELYLNLSRWSRRTDCLHPMKVDPETQIGSQKQYACVLPISYATMDSIHIKHARFGMLIPSIIHTVEAMLTARELSATLLKPLGIRAYLLLKDAISARSASEPTHYERLEFLGDSVLKYCTSIQAAATNLGWSEGYLSRYKDCLVANSRLSRAALETGLSKYILTVPFTGQKWRPFYRHAIAQGSMKKMPKRNLSTKVLADVVEALIGVSYTVGGIPKAIECLSVFINECSWEDPSECREEFFAAASSYCPPSLHLQPLEELLGYSFKKKSLLLEATTHSSYIGDTVGRSWERLEFIGDAVLDIIIVSKLINSSPLLPHSKMHMIKTAMVNKDFLAFLCLEEHELSQTQYNVLEDEVVVEEKRRTALWRFLRHSSNGIGPAQVETASRHQNIRHEIIHAIHHSDHYPWSILMCLHASKFYSDMIEALVGALWIDSGSLAQCEVFLARCGMMAYLDRILEGGVHMQHPKEELGKLAKARSIIYNIEQAETDDGGKEYSCKLLIGGQQMGEASGGLNAEEVRVKAATEAVALLKREADVSVGGDLD